MSKAHQLSVIGLFGHLNHDVKIRGEERITVLTGPNASGKTHLLKILAGIVGLDFPSLAPLPFREATVTYDDAKSLTVRRTTDDGSGILLVGRQRGRRPNEGSLRPLDLPDESDLPDYIEKVGPNLWVDIRDGERISKEILESRFDVRPGLTPDQACEELPWLTAFKSLAQPTLIETRRLETPQLSPAQTRARPRLRRPGAARRIAAYTRRISDLITDARAASLAISQQADRRFASRALDKARASVKESELRQRYEELSSLHQALHSNGLTEETPGVEFPEGRTNPTERRILDVFLDDWESKLAPLLPVHDKLELWRSVVGTKLQDKSIQIDGRGRIIFLSMAGDSISVQMLSSGEQHLLALYTMLLFAATPGSLVLIDEPEISLHAAWKHAFIEDVFRIASSNDLQMVLATHSTAVINGRWELVEELSLTLNTEK